jgi:hypothetical protein
MLASDPINAHFRHYQDGRPRGAIERPEDSKKNGPPMNADQDNSYLRSSAFISGQYCVGQD